METLISSITSAFAPNIAQYILGPEASALITLCVSFLLIVLTTLISNIVRAYKYCYEKNKRVGWGVISGLKKGILLSALTLVCSFIFSIAPYTGSVISGIDFQFYGLATTSVMALLYWFFYVVIVWPIWGGHC